MIKLITCSTCRHFAPYPPNPAQAVGQCAHPQHPGDEYWFAGVVHRCADHETKSGDAHDPAP